MPIDFPSTPASGQAYTFGTNTWVYNGTYWNAYINKPVISGQLSSNVVYSGNIASGQVGQDHISSGGIRSGAIASGQIGDNHFSSGMADGFSLNSMGGRLSLVSGVPIISGTATSSTIYYVPYVSDKVTLYDGTKWDTYTVGLVQGSLAGCASGVLYDVFLAPSGSSITVSTNAWASVTTRSPGTAIAYQDGVAVLSGSPTNRYVGTICTHQSGSSTDTLAKRYIWNYYNKNLTTLQNHYNTASWTMTSGILRFQNNDIANRLDVVCGFNQGIHATHYCDISSSAASTPQIRIVWQNTFPTSGGNVGTSLTAARRAANANMLNIIQNACTAVSYECLVGLNIFGACEFTNEAATQTFYGALTQGIDATWMC